MPWSSLQLRAQTALSLWHDNFKLLLVTLGEKGCKYYTKINVDLTNSVTLIVFLRLYDSVDPFHVKAVDTTGAGDSYVGAVLCNIVDDRTVLKDEARLREVLRFANACGAITTTKKGAIPALPTESEVQSLLNGN
ncbi:hypothetical protein HID58_035717 [Brassica napus]|uniref:(rape) hypothetical protein n=1 Tax=Brassica napus TaxID=3708 RepID=A0A816PGQ1_BRANA|nr:hypothetical protein HID58_035717 [Brassica napus]CAF2048584.1 unnamed protein product [Brassica napus]